MKISLEKCKTHFQENKIVYIILGVGVLVGVVIFQNQKLVKVNSWGVGIYKSPVTNNSIVNVVIPPRGNSGNAIQDNLTTIIYPSQNLAAKELGLNPGNLSSHLSGKNSSVAGRTFTKLTENGVPILVA